MTHIFVYGIWIHMKQLYGKSSCVAKQVASFIQKTNIILRKVCMLYLAKVLGT